MLKTVIVQPTRIIAISAINAIIRLIRVILYVYSSGHIELHIENQLSAERVIMFIEGGKALRI